MTELEDVHRIESAKVRKAIFWYRFKWRATWIAICVLTAAAILGIIKMFKAG